jgi:hypothetical protein
MPENPYEASISHGGVKDVSSPGADSDTKELLLSIGRWQSFFAVLGVIGCFVISLGLVVQLVVGGISLFRTWVIIFFCLGPCFVLPTLRLFQATALIRGFDYETGSIHKVLQAQRSFWRTIGILVLVGVGLYALLILFMLIGFGFWIS